MALVIDWPTTDKPVPVVGKNSKTFLVASGTTDSQIIGVFGQLWPKSDPSAVTDGTPITFRLGKAKRQGAPKTYCWQIYFPLAAGGGDYRLTVTGLTKEGDSEVVIRDFHVGTFAITVLSPSLGEDITGEAGDFVPYGSLIEFPLGDVTMTDSNNNVISPLHTFSDCIDLQFWSAQFPTLASETYVLFAEDANNSGASVSGLTVD
ncbi:MAG: hypothetical protein P4L84_21265 [Isosphaeraceae bacterium]|nr:hypothetical protein [Isosphaeraceae bacterium]